MNRFDKRFMVVMVILVLFGIFPFTVAAKGPHRMCYVGEVGCCCGFGSGFDNSDKLKSFRETNKSLFEEMARIRAEIRAMLYSPNPDWDKIMEKEMALSKLRVEIEKKAKEYGIDYRGLRLESTRCHCGCCACGCCG